MGPDSYCLRGSGFSTNYCCYMSILIVSAAIICTPVIIIALAGLPKLPTATKAAAVVQPEGMLPSEALHTRCALNMSAVPPCEPDIGQQIEAGGRGNFSFRQLGTRVPCSWKTVLVTAPSSYDALGPLRCVAPARVRPAAAKLPGSIYGLSPDAGHIVVERPGLYMAIGQLTWRAARDETGAGVALPVGLAVNDRDKLLCIAVQGPSRPGAYAYASCSVTGLLSLRAGDSVSLRARRAGAPVQVVSLESATRLEILLMSPLG